MVAYDKWAHAEAAAHAENGTDHLTGDARKLIVKFADPSRRAEDGRVVGVTPKKLFIGQVPPETTEEQIRSIFSQYGALVDVHVMHKDRGSGCAFATYTTWAEAEAAMEATDGKYTLPGAQHPLAVRFADAKATDVARVGAEKRSGELGGGAAGAGGGGGAGSGSSRHQASMQPMPSGYGYPGAKGMQPGYGIGYGMPGMGMGMGTMPMMGVNPMAMMMMYGQTMQQMGQQQQRGGAQGSGAQMGGPLSSRAGQAALPASSGQDSSAFPAGIPGLGGPMMPGMLGAAVPGMFPGATAMFPAGMQSAAAAAAAAAAAGVQRSALEAAKAWKLFIGQISYELSEQELYPFFAQWGTILELVLLRQPDGRSRGCGFVIYSSASEAEAALQAANGAVIASDPRSRPLTIKYAANRR